MIYPEFINEKSIVGICAPSMGVAYKIESYNKSISNLKKYFSIKETKSVRNKGLASNSPKKRTEEFNQLLEDKNISMIWCASGGEILLDILPYIDTNKILENIKWIQGYSDPTSLLYLITTKLDIATIYGVNAGGFDQDKLHISLINNLNILKGNIPIQQSFEYYEKIKINNNEYNLDTKVKWLSNKEEINIKGRLIGGCLECLNDIIGSKYDYTIDFIERYKTDGIIWYFDIYNTSSIQLYRTLLHMKYTGWFKYSKCFIFGRVLFDNCEYLTYYNAIKKVLKNTPFIIDADIGHTNPKITLINGSICNIKYKNNKGEIEFILK